MAVNGGHGRRGSALLFVLGSLLLAGCSPEEPGERIVNVEVLDDGQVVYLGSAQFPEREKGLSEPVVGWSLRTEVCLQNSLLDCARITPGTGHVEESRDGGLSWSTVLKIDQDEPWVGPLVESSYADADVEAYDLEETPDGQILVAMGRLGVVERNTDGEWSATDSDVRFLERTPALAVFAALAVLILALAWHRLRGILVPANPDHTLGTSWRIGASAITLALPGFLLAGASIFVEGGVGFYFLAAVLLGVPLGAASLLITLLTVFQCVRRDKAASFRTMRDSMATVAALGGALFAVALLWGSAFIGWHTAMALCALAALSALAVAGRPLTIELPAPTPVTADAP